jgi:hypothetical protein
MPRTGRPIPPVELSTFEPLFVSAIELEEWARQSFIEADGPLVNPDHQHLQAARIGMLWTNVENSRQMLPVVGQAELSTPPTSLSKWARARWEYQVSEWFGTSTLDFLITVYAPYALACDDLSFCALLEHELYHCAQRFDEFGAPKFRRDGTPVFGIRGHDVEEHVGIIRRYGVGGGAGRTAEFIDASKRIPEVGAARIAGACGTCALKLA